MPSFTFKRDFFTIQLNDIFISLNVESIVKLVNMHPHSKTYSTGIAYYE